MPTGIYKRTNFHRSIIKQAMIGKMPSFQNHHHTNLCKKVISLHMTGRKLSKKTKLKMSKPKTEITKTKMKNFWIKNKNTLLLQNRNKKISKKLLNNKNGIGKRTKRTCKNMSIARRGIPLSEEAKKKYENCTD